MVYYEMKIQREIDHPYIVKLEEVFETDNHLILNMEYMRGGTLLKRVVKRKRYSEKDSAIVMKKLILAVDYLHKSGIIHRDIKLENIFVANENDSSIKLADFDLAAYSDKLDYSK